MVAIAGPLLAIPFEIAWLWRSGIPTIQPGFWSTLCVAAPLLTAAYVLRTEARRRSTAIDTAAYICLTPLFTALIAVATGTGVPTIGGGVGLVVMTFGIYLLNARGSMKRILGTFLDLGRDISAVYMLIVAILFALTAVTFYRGVTLSSPACYMLASNAAVVVCASIVAMVWHKEGEASSIDLGAIKESVGLGVFLFIGDFASAIAVPYTKVVSYIIVGRRAGLIVLSIVSAVVLARQDRVNNGRETHQLFSRLTGVLVMLAGMIIILKWGKQ